VRRLLFALCLIAVAGTGCAVGVRQPATDITDTSATLNGKVLSTTGGPGSWYIEYTGSGVWDPAFVTRTPTRSIDFVPTRSDPVSEPVEELPPGRRHSYRVCAEDGENPGDPFCSPLQSFRTEGDTVHGDVVAEVFEGTPELELSYSFEAGSGPSGEDVSGLLAREDFSGRTAFGAPRCLSVQDNRAVIGIEWQGPFFVRMEYRVVEDGGPTELDRMGAEVIEGQPTDCAGVGDNVPLEEVVRGDLFVVDAEPNPS
jgi:hypothetical protein